MTTRIFRSICLVAVVTFLVTAVLVVGVSYEYFSESQQNQLMGQTELVAVAVEEQGYEYLEGVSETHDYRITWIAADGSVLFDTRARADEMTNHLEREEIKEALEKGEGEGSRYSDTLFERQMYAAKKLSDGTVIRLSYDQITWWTLLFGMLRPIIIAAAVVIAASLFVARRVSKSIVNPLNDLDLDDLSDDKVYAELHPFVTKISHQQSQIKAQAEEMERYRREFEAATEGMSEGIMLLNATGTILTVNPSAKKLLGISDYCIGKDLVLFNSNERLKKLIRSASKGKHSEAMLTFDGQDYQANASPVITGEGIRGVAIIIFDITEKEKAEEMRREFTANVSHELKTPLQTVSGCAELLKNNMVAEKDLDIFYDRIYSESHRLMTLVEDIIGLSQLDENTADLRFESVDLYDAAQAASLELAHIAAENDVAVVCDGESAVIMGVPQLVSGIIHNLCENAVKYNKCGGTVKITVRKEKGKAILTVKDTGIGIPKEERERIFERFYRVDKSRSKEVGGTGLGLSIVKHSAALHNAEISVESTVGEGTTIEVAFPLGA